MILNDQQYQITQQRVETFRASLAALDASPPPDPHDYQSSRGGMSSMLSALQREIAMWEAGIREPVPGNPDRPDLGVTIEQHNAMTEEEDAAFSERVEIAFKQAEIANIDRQIGITLDRIADWRRHRAWLEREISELTAATDRQPAASRA